VEARNRKVKGKEFDRFYLQWLRRTCVTIYFFPGSKLLQVSILSLCCSVIYYWLERETLKKIMNLVAFAKWRKSTATSFVLSVCPSAWNNSTPIRRILVNFSIWVFFEHLLRKCKFCENLTKITGTLYEYLRTFMTMSRWNSSYHKKCLGQKLQRKPKHTFNEIF
jgi:hypothetical protein